MSGVFDDRNNVGSLFSHIDEIAARPMRELNRVHETFLEILQERANNENSIFQLPSLELYAIVTFSRPMKLDYYPL